jgi:hypothetical protein
VSKFIDYCFDNYNNVHTNDEAIKKMLIIYRPLFDNTQPLNVLHIQQGHRKHILYVEYLLTRISEGVSIVFFLVILDAYFTTIVTIF